MAHHPAIMLPALQEKYYKLQHFNYESVPTFLPSCQQTNKLNNPIAVVYPNYNDKIYIPVERDGKRGSVVFQAAHSDEKAELYWHIDSYFVGTTKHFHEMALQPSYGKHKLTIVDKLGNKQVRHFEILNKGSN